jgi:hypothetical protein
MPSGDEAAGGMPGASGSAGAGPGEQGSKGAGEQGTALTLEQALGELEKARKALKEANNESAGRRKRLEELEQGEAKRKELEMSEAQKTAKAAADLQAKVAELERQAQVREREQQERVIRYEVMLKASGLGVIDPDAAVKLMDWSALEFDEGGQPKNLEKVLRDLVKAKPYLVKPPAQGASGPNINAGESGRSSGQPDAGKVEELKRRFRLG